MLEFEIDTISFEGFENVPSKGRLSRRMVKEKSTEVMKNIAIQVAYSDNRHLEYFEVKYNGF